MSLTQYISRRLPCDESRHSKYMDAMPQTYNGTCGECPNSPGRMECVPIGCNTTLLNSSYGETGYATVASGADMLALGATANVTCNTGYFLRMEGDGGGVTTCNSSCGFSLTSCQPVVCAQTGLPVANSVMSGAPAQYTYPNRSVRRCGLDVVLRACACDAESCRALEL